MRLSADITGNNDKKNVRRLLYLAQSIIDCLFQRGFSGRRVAATLYEPLSFSTIFDALSCENIDASVCSHSSVVTNIHPWV